jgi:tRNA threonylcarbamoyladenosine modification (KEOPS) complex Cgi121 subunit
LVLFLGFAGMITREFDIPDLKMQFFAGISQIDIDLIRITTQEKIKKESDIVDFLINFSGKIQNKYKDSILQFFSDTFVLNEDHIFAACYYVQKAFFNNQNISNKKNIELLLYLASNRQIKNAVNAFGITIDDLNKKKLSYCIISSKNNLISINNEVVEYFNAKELEFNLNDESLEKLNRIKNYFEISDNQINVVLNSFDNMGLNNNELELSFNALYDLICEKMALLSIEKA